MNWERLFGSLFLMGMFIVSNEVFKVQLTFSDILCMIILGNLWVKD